MAQVSVLAEKSQLALDDFSSGQEQYYNDYRQRQIERANREAENPFTVELRKRLSAIYQNEELPDEIRTRAYVFWHVSDAYVQKKATGWPMPRTSLRPEFPEYQKYYLGSGTYAKITDTTVEYRCGWLYRVHSWVESVEKRYLEWGLGDDI